MPAMIKLFAAATGGSAVVAMAGLGVAIGQQPGAEVVMTSSHMNVGATSTETTPSAVPATAKALPGIKGPAKFRAN
jgi:hypothetical protein